MTNGAIVYTLPFPPGVNGLYRNVPGKGRVKTQRYLTWSRAAQNEMLAQRSLKRHRWQPGPVVITIRLCVAGRPNRRRDLDGHQKAPIDMLVAMNVIEDDSKVQRIVAEWVTDGPPCTISVEAHND